MLQGARSKPVDTKGCLWRQFGSTENTVMKTFFMESNWSIRDLAFARQRLLLEFQIVLYVVTWKSVQVMRGPVKALLYD